jgi:hypothetical protein
MASRQKTTLYLEADAYRRLKLVARDTGDSPAALVRIAIDEFLDRRPARRLPRSLGTGRSKTGDLSEKVEDLLGGFGESRRRRGKTTLPRGSASDRPADRRRENARRYEAGPRER